MPHRRARGLSTQQQRGEFHKVAGVGILEPQDTMVEGALRALEDTSLLALWNPGILGGMA